ncbi:hypothetical protein, partial [uncultured Chryseobacterium sp.]|uniref:hypothetical protein n=1 Tax=uncultured Chryseobacterium sp. TaxID=259322 RepID=UPI0027DE263E
SNMKKENKYIIYLKIWLIHIVIYYLVFGLITEYLDQWYREWSIDWGFLGRVLSSPLIGGVFGFDDGFPMYFILPIVIFLILEIFPKLNTFYSYIISTFLSYVVIKYLIYFNRGYPFNILLRSNQKEESLELSLLYAILPALLISSICVYIFLRK